jgi:hypothetical protein
VCIGCWRALSDVRWIERIEHADHIIFYIQYFPVKIPPQSPSLPNIISRGGIYVRRVCKNHTSHDLTGKYTYIPPRDIIFGSDGDWGGIYISRALFSPIPVDNDDSSPYVTNPLCTDRNGAASRAKVPGCLRCCWHHFCYIWTRIRPSSSWKGKNTAKW